VGSEPGANEEAKATARKVADPKADLPIGALGSGSDYSAYLQHLGLASIDFGYGGEGESGGVYHSLYDDYEHHSRFVDPGFAYDATLARTVGRAVLRLANTDLPVQRYGDFADTVSTYLDEVKALAATRRTEAETQARLISGGLYKLADDPLDTRGEPTPLKPVPFFNFSPLENAVEHLKRSARDYDRAAAGAGALSAAQKAQLSALLLPMEQTLLNSQGLPGRPWYQHMIYAPGRFTGYGAKTLPGVREAIEQRRFDDARTYVVRTAKVLEDYANRLDAAVSMAKVP